MKKRPAPKGTKPCGAKTRQRNRDGSPKLCANPGDGAGGRCRFHGGKSLSGPANAAWKHGGRSVYMPAKAAERFLEGMHDKNLMRLRQDVALVEMLLTGLTATLPKHAPPSEAIERRIVNLVDQRRRLIESEHRRLDTLQQSVTLAQFLATMRIVAEIIREFVQEPTARAEVQRRLTQLLVTQGRPETIDGEATEAAEGVPA
jgi:hypothetical protein